MTLLFGLLRLSFLVESPILQLAFFKTILAALFRAFGLPLSFLPSKPSFLHDHSTTQHSDFSSFLAISTTDKPVNRSIQAYALTQHNVFALRGLIFRDIHKKNKEGPEIERFGLWNTKNVWLENILAHANEERTLGHPVVLGYLLWFCNRHFGKKFSEARVIFLIMNTSWCFESEELIIAVRSLKKKMFWFC